MNGHNSQNFIPLVRSFRALASPRPAAGVQPLATPESLASPTPLVNPTPLAEESQVFVGAGDIARCDSPGAGETAKLLDGIAGTIFTLGDNAYLDGSATNFADCYEPTWGRFKSRTHPAAGNHEYINPGASAYFDYFGAAAGERGKGYYSYELGDWHIVVLNSNCDDIGGCNEGSAQEQWLRADLAAHPATCTLAYWHHPLFSSGPHGSTPNMAPLWQALYQAGTELVLSGHDHDYERFLPQDANGVADPQYGIREIVAGTGGGSHYTINKTIANSEIHNTDTYGVLKLTLHAASYEWEFIPEAGKSFTDTGSGLCHGAPQG